MKTKLLPPPLFWLLFYETILPKWLIKSSGLRGCQITTLAAFCLAWCLVIPAAKAQIDPSKAARWVQNSSLSATTLIASDNQLFAGTNFKGVYRSNDNGSSWTGTSNGLPESSSVTCFAVSGGILFAGVNWTSLDGQTGGVFFSKDNGTNWDAISSPEFNYYRLSVSALVVTGNSLYAGTQGGGVFTTVIDRLESLTAVKNGIPESAFITSLAASKDGKFVYAGATDGFYVSDDGGNNWTAQKSGLPELASVQALAEAGNYLFASVSGRIFASTDNGYSWNIGDRGFPADVVAQCFAENGGNLIAGTTNFGTFLLDNAQYSWQEANAGFSEKLQVQSLTVNGSNLVAATNAGIWVRAFPFTFQPVITSFTPTSSSTGAEVNIYGSGFLGATAVNFGDTPAASFSVKNDGYIIAYVGIGSSGTISVITESGTGTSTDYFYFFDSPGTYTPAISSFSPTSGPVGTEVTITGTNFDPTPANNRISFGAITVPAKAGSSATTLLVDVPAGATSIAPIVVQNTITGLLSSSITSQPAMFTVTTTPSVAINYTASAVDVGTKPYSIAIGDFNGDGKADFATANYVSNNVSIRLGDGTGGFSGGTQIGVGSVPYSIAIGDFNGDGKADFATANFVSNDVSIRLGDGTGGFSGSKQVGVGSKPYSLAIGDFNGDGRADVATANTGSNDVSIRLGDGLGGFSGSTQVGVGTNPYSIAIGDFNGDGKADVATANPNSANVSVRLGDGTGGFFFSTEIGVLSTATSIAIGDFNRDGKADFATANYGSNGVSIRLGDGSGGFSGSTQIGVTANPFSIAIGDFNGDGKADFATANTGSNDVSILLGDGAGGFSGDTKIMVGISPLSIAIGDFNGDGKADLATANTDSNNVSVLLWSPPVPSITSFSPSSGPVGTEVTISGTNFDPTPANNNVYFGPIKVTPSGGSATSLTVTVPAGATSIAPITVQDVTTGLQASSLTSSTKRFTITPSTVVVPNYAASSVLVGTNPFAIAIADFNGDGKADLATANYNANEVAIRLANDVGGFTGDAQVGVGTKPTSIGIGDFNGDGRPDIAVANSGSNDVSIRLGNVSGMFSGAIQIGVGTSPSSIAIGDFNKDGLADFATSNSGSQDVSIRFGNGMGGFSGSTQVLVGSNPSAVLIGDFNADGNLDFATTNEYSDDVSIRLGDGSGGFSGNTQISTGSGSRPQSLAIGDLDGDGKEDLVTANYNSNNLSIRFGTGSATQIPAGVNPRSVVIGDFDGDGKADLAIANQGDNNVIIRLGDGSGAFSGGTQVSVGTQPSSIAVGDFNSDGKADLATANYYSNDVSVLLWTTPAPSITSFSPSSGSVGTEVTITGTNFTNDSGLDFNYITGVSFGGVAAASFVVNSATEITAVVGNGASGNVSVTTPYGTVTSSDVFSFISIPTITSFSPTSGYTGEVVTVEGTGFDPSPEKNKVYFGGIGADRGTRANVLSATATELTVQVPDFGGITFRGPIFVEVDGQSTESSDKFTLLLTQYPTITYFDPLSGVVGSEVTIVGSNFYGSSVYFNGIQAVVSEETPSYLKVTVPSGATTGRISVNTSGGEASSEQDFEVLPSPPVITSFSPASGAVGTTVTITGTNFNATAANNRVFFGAIKGTPSAVTATSLTVTVPPGATSITPLVVQDIVSGLQGSSLSSTTPRFTVTSTNVVLYNYNPATIGVGTNPRGAATGDFNGDGKTDFAAVNEGTNNVTIKLGNGNGGFSGSTTVNVGTSPGSIATGDFNGDGNLDFVTANFGSNNVSVRLGDGAGGFSGTALVSVGSGPVFIVVDDLNADGKLDFATADFYDNTVTIRLGNGVGGFSGGTSIAVGSNPYSVAFGDFNGDGKTDFATANYSSNDVSVQLGNGLGAFEGSTTIAVGSNPQSIAIGDFNGDAKADFATANYDSRDVTVKLGNGSGLFPTGTTLSEGFFPHALVIGDFNGDSKADIAVANGGASSNISIRLGDGTGNFAVSTTFAAPNPPESLTLGDFNGDSKPDFLSTNWVSNNANVLLSAASQPPNIATFSPTSGPVGTSITITGTNFDPTPANNRVSFGAITVPAKAGSTTTTLLVDVPAGATSIAPIVVQNTTTGLLSSSITSQPAMFTITTTPQVALNYTASTVSVGTTPSAIAIGDFNGDGKADFANANYNDNNVSIRLGDGKGGFSGSTQIEVGSVPYSIAIGDFNGDGKADFATANTSSNNVSIRLGDGSGGFSGSTNIEVGTYPKSIAIGDFNGDGKADFATANLNSSDVSIRLGDGTGGFSGSTQIGLGALATSIAIGDFNRDGKADFAAANNITGVNIRLGDGTGGFSGTTQIGVGSAPGSIAIGDFNGDGNADFATANSFSNDVSIRLGDGSGGFSGSTQIGVGTDPESIAIGDFNGDGKADFATANAVSNDVSIRLGDGSGGFSGSTQIGLGTGPLSIAIGDFNGDGKADLATANVSAGNVSALLWSPPPSITSFTPASGSVGTEVTITGTNFTGATAVTFGGVAAASFTVTSATSISAVVATGASGSVSVTTPGGTASLPGFTFTPLTPPGNALAFDGINDMVAINNTLGNFTGAFTIEAWVKTTSTSLSTLFAKRTDVSYGNFFRLSVLGNGKLSFELDQSTAADYTLASGTRAINDGRWHHVAAVRTPTQLQLFVDGAQDGVSVPINGSPSINNTAAFTLGHWLSGGAPIAFFNGTMDELRVYNSALAQADIQADMLSTVSAVPANLLANYNFDQGAAGAANANNTTLLDNQSINHGTLTNFALTGTTSNWVESYAMVVPIVAAASNATTTSFTANWFAPQIGTVSNYLVDVSTNSTFTSPISGSPFATLGTATSQLISSLTPGTFYYYRVRANKTSVSGQGAYSTSITQAKTLSLPTLTATPSSVTLAANTYGTPSAESTFSFAASFLPANQVVTISAPAAVCEVSFTSGSGYASSITATADANGVIPGTTVYVRIRDTNSPGTSNSNITLTGGGASSTVNFTGNTSKKNLTITGIAVTDKVYNRLTAATLTGATLTGIVPLSGDVVTLVTTGVTANFADFNAGLGKTVTASGYTISGTAATKYNIVQPTGLTGNISPRPLTITGITANDKTVDGTTVATLSGTASIATGGVISPDVATLGGTPTATFANADVGSNKTVSVTGYTVSNANYSITQPTLTASIIAVPPSITSFLPLAGAVGTEVTIAGNSFNTTASNNVVYFGATRATVTGATAIGLTVTVPVGATYAPITVLDIASGLLASSNKNFMPTFSPNKGSIGSSDFGPKLDFATGSFSNGAKDVAIGDMDGDGKSDLVVPVSNNVLSTLSVFRNTSSVANINYAPKIDFASLSGNQEFKVAIGDLDGDGKLDAAVVSSNNIVSVYRNISAGFGDINFANKVDFPTGSSPSAIAIGDLDGDGKADLAITNRTSNTISVYRNISTGPGNIGYATKFDLTTGSIPNTIAIGDFDDDGKADLAVGNASNISIFRNTSSGVGSISYGTKVDLPALGNPAKIEVGDLDNDGKIDIAACYGGNPFSVFRNISVGIGNINFATKTDFLGVISGLLQYNLAIDDLNGDGKLDLALATNNQDIRIYTSTSTGPGNINFVTFPLTSLGTVKPVFQLALGDLDGDGKSDIVFDNPIGQTISIIRNNPAPSITTSAGGALAANTYGTPSAESTFSFAASLLPANQVVTIAAPAAVCEVSFTSGSGYASSITATTDANGTIPSTTVYVRIRDTNSPGTSNNNITLTGGGASSTVNFTGNTTKKNLTITGIAVTDKIYNRLTAATLTGATLTGIVPLSGDVVTLVTTGVTANFADFNAGLGKAVTASGYTISGTAATKYI